MPIPIAGPAFEAELKGRDRLKAPAGPALGEPQPETRNDKEKENQVTDSDDVLSDLTGLPFLCQPTVQGERPGEELLQLRVAFA